MSEDFQVGDRVVTPTGRTGAIVKPDQDFPLHHLIAFDNGTVFWMLKSILKLCPVAEVPTKTKKRVKAKSCYSLGRRNPDKPKTTYSEQPKCN